MQCAALFYLFSGFSDRKCLRQIYFIGKAEVPYLAVGSLHAKPIHEVARPHRSLHMWNRNVSHLFCNNWGNDTNKEYLSYNYQVRSSLTFSLKYFILKKFILLVVLDSHFLGQRMTFFHALFMAFESVLVSPVATISERSAGLPIFVVEIHRFSPAAATLQNRQVACRFLSHNTCNMELLVSVVVTKS